MFRGKLDILIHSYSNLRGAIKGNIKEDTQNQAHKRK